MINPSCVSSEPWANEECPSRLVAAYQLGRLLNCLDWTMLRSALGCSPTDSEELSIILTRLTEFSHLFDRTGNERSVRCIVGRTYADYKARNEFELECWRESLAEEVKHEPNKMVDWSGYGSDDILDAVRNSLDPMEQVCIDIGCRLDQGVRPLRLELRLLLQSLNASRVDPAGLPQDPHWEGDILGLLGRLGLRADLPLGVAGTGPAKVVALDRLIRKQLEEIAGAKPKRERQRIEQPVPDDVIQTEVTLDWANPAEIETLKAAKDEVDPKDTYIGQSLPILRMFEKFQVCNQRPDDAEKPPNPMLLLGETGAGKTVLAKLIHDHSRRTGEYSYVQASSTLGADEAIVRRDWLGHGKESGLPGVGCEAQDGRIQSFQGGTIFLDEFHVTPRWFQVNLIQLIDRTEMNRSLGVSDPIAPDIRMLFASNKKWQELEKCVNHDLLDRLRRWTIEVPPLRRRKEDIVYFVKTWCAGHEWDYRFLLALFKYDWPGNVRELKETLELSKRELRKALERNKRKAESTSGKLKRTLKRSKRKAESTSGTLTLDNLHLGEPGIVDAVRRLDKEEAEREVWLFLIHSFEKQGLRKGDGLHKHLADFWNVNAPVITKKLKRLQIDTGPHG